MAGERIARADERVRPRGVHFPFTKRSDGIPSVDIPPDIFVSNVKQILLTTPGERVMRPTFGSNLRVLLFSQLPSPFIEENIRFEVKRVINIWEPRVSILDIKIDVKETEIRIEVVLVSPLGTGRAEVTLETA